MRPTTRSAFSPLSCRSRLLGALASALLLGVTSSAVLAQNNAADDARRRRTDDNTGGRRGFNPQDMQERLLTSLRERLEVPDDEEWKIISERLTKVAELRRNSTGTAGGMAAFAGRAQPPGGDNRGGRGTRTSANPEMTALQTAVRDKLPDAEIKSRLDRVREVRRENEAKLAKAQEELRAVLSVRQEAVAVVFGLLP
jgi:hypothetical protein